MRKDWVFCVFQLLQAQKDQFNLRAHVEYEWYLGQDDIFESDDELDEKVRFYLGGREGENW